MSYINLHVWLQYYYYYPQIFPLHRETYTPNDTDEKEDYKSAYHRIHNTANIDLESAVKVKIKILKF